MRKVIATVGEKMKIEGVDFNTTLKGVREQLQKKGYTEINVVYRAGKHIITFLTGSIDRLILIDVGLIKGSKEERKQHIEKTKNIKVKIDNLGYAW